MTKTERTTIIAKIDARSNYDASTVRIAKDGTITAKLDANKTFAGWNPRRYFVCNVADFSDPRHPYSDIEAAFA